jgi:hypothetical protein
MDRYTCFSLLTHYKEGVNVDSYSICELYAATLADVSEKISNDEMYRLLIVGSFLFQVAGQSVDSSLFPHYEEPEERKMH